MSTEQYSPFADKKESDDDGDNSEKDKKETRFVPLPSRPMFEHLVPVPRPEKAEKKDDEEDEEDDDDDDGAKPPAVAAPADAETGSDEPEPALAEAEPVVAAEQASEAEPEPPAVPEELADEWVLYPNQEPPEQPAESVPLSAAEQEDDDDTVAPLTAGGSTPPLPPIVPPTFSGAERPEPEPAPRRADIEPTITPGWGGPDERYNSAPAPAVSLEEHKEAVEDSERLGLRRGLIAGFITGYVVKAYLARKKFKRYEKETERRLDERDQNIGQLQREQYDLNRRVSTQAEQLQAQQHVDRLARPGQPVETLPLVKAAEEHVFDQEGNEIVLQPGWHVERSTGGYSVVLDEHNRVVNDAIHYGEAFHRDRKREQVNDDVFATDTTVAPVADDTHAGQQAVMPPAQAPPLDPSHELEAGQPRTVDIQHRLPRPRSPVAAAVASPWLWTAIALLLIVYFLAALA